MDPDTVTLSDSASNAGPDLGRGRVARLGGIRALCVGDIMLDRFVYGAVNRVSPEAPIPVLSISREDSMPGGVGNVARNVASLSGAATLIAVVGEDQPGSDLEAMIADNPRMESRMISLARRPTTIKTRFISHAQQLLRADQETTEALQGQGARWVAAAVEEALVDTDVVILSDYQKGVLTPEVLSSIIAAARAQNLPIIVDPKGHDYSKYTGATLIKPNLKELAEATRLPVGSNEEVVAAAEQLRTAHGFEAVLVTRSEEGMTLVTAEGAIHLSARAREVFDVSGAGDTVAACLGLAIGAGLPLQTAAELANAAGGIVVGKVGTACIFPSELRMVLHGLGGDIPDVLDRVGAIDRATYWRERGEIVGFTNGCFDLIHPGHVSLLKQARAACDRLIVGVNSDASVKRLKGENRPVQTEVSRATVLSSLEMVDAVVIFDEDTPYNLIDAVRPEVLVKGADYTIDQVVGADLVQGWGGSVVLAQLEDGHSTTNTISKMAT